MVERYRSRIPPESAPTLAPRKARPPLPVFVCIPRQVLTQPPIRHRGAPADAGLSVFEFVVGVACAALARRVMMKEGHQYALNAGKMAMEAKRNSEQPVHNKASWPPREQFEAAGSYEYWKARRKFAQARPGDNLTIRCTRSALLHCAGLSLNQRNARNLSNAMWRLSRPAADFPALVLSWRGPTTTSDVMEIHVNGWWVPRRRYIRIPWPAPTIGAGATSLSLYLWLHGTDTRATSQTKIRVVNLYRRCGIPLSRPERSLARALDVINNHLRRLNATGALDEERSPTGFEILPSAEGTLVHVQAHKAQAAIDHELAELECAQFEREQFWRDDPPEDDDGYSVPTSAPRSGYGVLERKIARMDRR